MTNHPFIAVFCEGNKESLDYSLLSLIFNKRKVMLQPSGSCGEVKKRVDVSKRTLESVLSLKLPTSYCGTVDRDRGYSKMQVGVIRWPIAEIENFFWHPSLWPIYEMILNRIENVDADEIGKRKNEFQTDISTQFRNSANFSKYVRSNMGSLILHVMDSISTEKDMMSITNKLGFTSSFVLGLSTVVNSCLESGGMDLSPLFDFIDNNLEGYASNIADDSSLDAFKESISFLYKMYTCFDFVDFERVGCRIINDKGVSGLFSKRFFPRPKIYVEFFSINGKKKNFKFLPELVFFLLNKENHRKLGLEQQPFWNYVRFFLLDANKYIILSSEFGDAGTKDRIETSDVFST
jgi:hypothetical protein